MERNELNQLLEELGLSQGDLAALTGLSLRTVSLWSTGQRPITGPAAAYLNLLNAVPRSFLVIERNRIRGDLTMPEGMYLVEFGAGAGTGAGVLILDKGTVYGADSGMGKYDGEYAPSQYAGHTYLKMNVSVPPGVNLVQGVPAQEKEYAFSIESDVPTAIETVFTQATPFGDVKVRMRKLRDLPKN